MHTWQIAVGSVPGRDHISRNGLLIGRNNQDAFAWQSQGETLVAVVCDGCSGGAHSEVGATIGARVAVRIIMNQLQKGALSWDATHSQMLEELRSAASLLGGDIEQVVGDYLLFTIVAAVITPETVSIATIGDGVYAVNGQVSRVGPFADNAPPYLGYGLMSNQIVDPDALKFDMRIFETAQVSSVLIGSDGVFELLEKEGHALPGRSELVGHVSQFWEKDAYFINSQALRRRLVLLNSEATFVDTRGELVRQPGLLGDDTTILVLRRAPITE